MEISARTSCGLASQCAHPARKRVVGDLEAPTGTSTFHATRCSMPSSLSMTDGRRMKLDEERTMQLIAPCQEQAWAKTYIQRAERLNLLPDKKSPVEQPSASQSVRTLGDSWQVYDLIEPEALMSSQGRQLSHQWNSAAPSYRRNILRWIAKLRDSTKEK